MTGFWYDPLIHGLDDGPAQTLGATVNTETWPGGTTLGATLSTSTYSEGVSLGDTPNTEEWPPTGGASPIDFFGQDDESGATARAITANFKAASPFVLTEDADIVNMYAYLDGGGAVNGASQVFKGVIYADAGGTPTALMATTIEATVTDTQAAGWVELSFATLVELPAATYWLGILIGPTNGIARYYTQDGVGSEKWNADTYAGGASDPFGTPDGTEAWTDCIYATYIPSAVAPSMLFEDGFENQNHANWGPFPGLSGGRLVVCDCDSNNDGIPDVPADPLDSYIAYGTGYAYRVTSRVACRGGPQASGHSGCELIKDWGISEGYKMGDTEFYAIRARIVEPYGPQTDFCLIAQCGYPSIRGPGWGINLYNEVYVITMNWGFNTSAGYNNAHGYFTRAVGIPAPNTAAGNFGVAPHTHVPGQWRDWLLEIRYSTIFGASATNPVTGAAISMPVTGYAVTRTRLPDVTSSWTTLWDTRSSSCATAAAAPAGSPTRQWGWGFNTPPFSPPNWVYEVDHNGVNVATAGIFTIGNPRKVSDKTGIYRANPNVSGYAGKNDNTLIVDRRFAVAATEDAAETWLDQLA